jgi:hypothetical protein
VRAYISKAFLYPRGYKIGLNNGEVLKSFDKEVKLYLNTDSVDCEDKKIKGERIQSE